MKALYVLEHKQFEANTDAKPYDKYDLNGKLSMVVCND